MPAPPPPAAARPVPRIALAVLAGGLALIALAAWVWSRQPPPNPLDALAARAVADFGRNLPKDYGNGLVLEAVDLRDGRLVMRIRSTRRSLASAAGDPAAFERVRQAEWALMQPLCRDARVRPLLDQGLVIVRRYLDPSDRLFFELALGADDCRRAETPTPNA